MLNKIIEFSLHQRWFVLGVVALLAAIGVYNYQRLPIDAVPDITNVQVQINTEAPGFSPLEAEQRITFRSRLRWRGCRAWSTRARCRATACRR
jgi:cobalt-zinc-cadmium resistance protein CzcA